MPHLSCSIWTSSTNEQTSIIHFISRSDQLRLESLTPGSGFNFAIVPGIVPRSLTVIMTNNPKPAGIFLRLLRLLRYHCSFGRVASYLLVANPLTGGTMIGRCP
jgi:hypothetical protein